MKILMVGLGSIGQRHLRNILKVLGDEAEISAYRVRKEQGVVTERLSIEEGSGLDRKYAYTLYDDLESALSASPKAVFICNPSSKHIPVALAAARKGCHLFIEKPLSHNLEGIEELISLVNEKGIVGIVGFQLRFHPCFVKLKSLIQEGSIGNILSVHIEVGEYLPDWHRWEDYRRMYAARKDLGGGVVLTQIHEIDYASDLFGQPRSVYALGGHFSSLELDVEDTANILMECNYRGRVLPVFIHMDYLQKPPTRECKVIGEKGTITMDLCNLQVVTVDNDGKTKVYQCNSFDRNQLFLDEMRHFFACIRNEAKPVVDLKIAFAGMKTAVAIKRSIENGEKVLLNF